MRARRPSTAASSTRTLADVGAEPPKRGGGHALGVLEQGRQEVLGVERRALGVGGEALGGEDGLLGLLGVAVSFMVGWLRVLGRWQSDGGPDRGWGRPFGDRAGRWRR